MVGFVIVFFCTLSGSFEVSIKVTEHIFSQKYLVFKKLYVKHHQFYCSKT